MPRHSMLRPSAGRAFAGPQIPPSEMPPAPAETRRDVALAHLFRDLRSLLDEEAARRRRRAEHDRRERAERAAEREVAADDEIGADSVSVDPDDPEALSVSEIRALPSGVEFSLAGPARSCRFRDTLAGYVHVTVTRAATSGSPPSGGTEPDSESGVDEAVAHGALLREEILSVHPYWGVYRPILKPIDGEGGPTRARTAFCYTSAVELAEHYLDLAVG